MTEAEFFDLLLAAWFALSALVFVVVSLVSAPYGRHNRDGWGPAMPARVGWVLMELPPVVIFGLLLFASDRLDNPVAWVLFAMWQSHYLYRAFIYPFRSTAAGKKMPVLVMSLGFSTHLPIDYLNARWLFAMSPLYETSWLVDPRFLVGCTLFFAGMALNHHADDVLRRLRKPGEGGYKVPYAGAFRWVSCPNYLGEIIEWTGWAVATWSLPGLAFAVWTAANLVPRARSHHRWYEETFADYPRGRRALIPGIF